MRTAAAFLLLASAASAQTGTLEGTIRYRDRTYSSSGFTGTADRFVRRARVEVIRVSDNAVVGTDFTDDSGFYSMAGVPRSDAELLFLRVYAETDPAFATISVRNNASQNALLTAASANFLYTTIEASPKLFNLTMTTFGIAGAFNILDVAVWSAKYLLDFLGEVGLPALQLYWFESSTNGTFFSRTQDAVFLLGKASDPDEYDDDIILHEIGHWAAFHYSKDDSPGGAHTIIDQSDLRLAHSEGWAHYWSSTVRRYANTIQGGLYALPHGFVDNFGTGNSFFEIDTPSLASQTVTARNQIACAHGVWRLTQTVAAQELNVWTSFKEILALSLPQVSLEDFRARLVVNLSGANYLALFGDDVTAGFYKNRLVRYYLDADDQPQNNVPPGVGAGLPFSTTERTLFDAGDEDWFTFVLPTGSFHVETLNLKDGCDTVIELYDGVGTLLASNDDRLPSDKSSLIDFQINVAGTYRVRVIAFAGAGAIAQHGYYDLQADIIANAIPVISTALASPISGNAPLRVEFTVAASDADGNVHSYEWDFDGDGRYDYSSIQGGNVVNTYDLPGTYTALLRVTDNGDRTAFATAIITVGGDAGSASIDATFTGTTAPATVTYTIDAGGIAAVSYEWDFEGDGIIDAASVVSNVASVVYRAPTSVIAKGYVTDRFGRRYQAAGTSSDGFDLVISPGGGAPTITGFSATSTTGTIPFNTILSVVSAAPTKIEWDFDGDGRFDLDSGTTPSVLYQYQRVGTFTARVRVMNASGQTATATLGITTTQVGVSGWMVEPREGDKVAGSSVTLTAEAVPRGQTKKVQFQFRQNFPVGSWIDIGSPIVSEGTRFTVQWNTNELAPLSAFDVRILIDDAVSSGDTDNTVTIDPSTPDIAESGPVKDRVIAARTFYLRNAAGVEIIVPQEAVSSGSGAIRIEPTQKSLGRVGAQVGSAWRLSFASGSVSFKNAFLLRLPVSGSDLTNLAILRYDEQAGTWRREYASTVRIDEGVVEVRATEMGVYAIVVVHDGGGGGGGSACFGSVAQKPLAFPAIAVILGVLCTLFWRRSRSS